MIKHLNISQKLKVGFLFVIIITCIVGGLGIRGMQKISAADQSLFDQQTKPLQYISNMIQSVELIRIEERNAIIYSGNNTKINEIEKNIETYNSVFKENQTMYLSTLKVLEGINLVKGAGEIYDNSYMPNVKKTLDYAAAGDVDQALITVDNSLESVNEIVGTYEQCFKNSNRDALSKSNSNKRLAYILTITLIAIIIVGVIASIWLCLAIIKSISKPMEELVSVSEQFAKGNLSTKIAYESKNEIGQLADSLRSVFQSLQNIVVEISETLEKISQKDISTEALRDYGGDFAPISESVNTILDDLNGFFSITQTSAEQVSSGSGQVASGAQALAQGSLEQANTIEEIFAAASDVSKNAKDSNKNVVEAVQSIDKTTKYVNNSNSQMKGMLLAMGEIEESSSEISKIIMVIDSIAFQTNILALNAAVEAARAGEAGKGFSVVAEEVRNLAAKSADAAKQTAQLIESSIEKVKEGSSMANNTAQALDQATLHIQNVEKIIRQIEQASILQADAMVEISQGIEQVSAVVQTNSATSQESAAASEELSSQANMLKNEITKFKLRASY